MTTSAPQRLVVISALGSVAVIVGANAARGRFPTAKQGIAAGLLFVGVAALADADPRMAGPASGLAFASIAISQGLDFAKGLDSAKSYQGAVKTAAPVSTVQGAAPGILPAGSGSPLTGVRGSQQSAIVASAMSWLGVPYRWAGNDRSGVDCSGLTKQVYGSVGISLPRVSTAQYHSAGRIYKDTNPPAGAEVFFNWIPEVPPGHCGISIGGGQFIHAPHTGDVVKMSSLADYLKSGAKWYGYTLPFQKG